MASVVIVVVVSVVVVGVVGLGLVGMVGLLGHQVIFKKRIDFITFQKRNAFNIICTGERIFIQYQSQYDTF